MVGDIAKRAIELVTATSYWKLRHTQYSISHGMMVLGATDRIYCIDLSLSKFYSSGDPLFLGVSPSPVFTVQ